jgi:hypothetical protein
MIHPQEGGYIFRPYVLVPEDILCRARMPPKIVIMSQSNRHKTKQRTGSIATSPARAARAPAPQITPEQRFIDRGHVLLTGWRKRVSERSSQDQKYKNEDEDPDEWLRRKCYAYLRKTIADSPDVIANLLTNLHGRHKRGPDIAGKPFKQGLLLLASMPEMRPVAEPGSAGQPLCLTSLQNLRGGLN